MLKPLIQIYPVLPARDEAERAALRPIGRNRDIYQRTLQGWHDIVRAADDLGLWGAATIEHHFWSEGYEVGPNPGILDAYWAAITRTIRVGQLGYVMSTQNPIRIAEETAILDHLTQGRTFVGLARGYQSRWTNVLGQHYGTRATKSPAAAAVSAASTGIGFSTATTREKDLADDAHNRAVFEEGVEILLKAWSEDSFSHRGLNWSIPFPHDTGVEGWQLAEHGITQRLGAPREIGPDGAVREICVAPAPYTKPHPPVFVSGSGSPETIEYCARKGFIPVYFTNIGVAAPLSRRYVDIATRAGHAWRAGQNQCLVRWMQIGRTEEDARNRVMEYDSDIFRNFYAAMGRRKLNPDDVYGSILGSGLYVVGTVESVRRQLIEQWREFPAEYLTLIFHYAQMPKEAVIETLEAFMRHIKPALDEVIEQSLRRAA
jgi:alkanesulfonate monooxygenase SsuD/methylene tetrahydromethanopterin reductase-like flavin-dependent oxidoreductase (luciferase family)